MPDFLEFQDIRGKGMFPAILDLKHRDTKVVLLDNYMRRGLNLIHGIDHGVGYVALVDQFEALRVHTHGTGFDHYTVQADTAPDSFSSANEINDTFIYHRWDFLIESEEAEVRFVDDDSVFGDAIPLLVGYTSLLFTSRRCQIRKRNTTAGTYTITAYRGHVQV